MQIKTTLYKKIERGRFLPRSFGPLEFMINYIRLRVEIDNYSGVSSNSSVSSISGSPVSSPKPIRCPSFLLIMP